MIITRIYIYPVKSLAGIEIKEAYVTDKGLEFDRRWLLVDENNEHITQRTVPKLVSFQPTIKSEGISILHKPTQKACYFSFKPQSEKLEKVKVWNDSFGAIEVDAEISAWFSEILGLNIRLMYQPDSAIRKVDSKYAVSGEEIVSAADGYPILVTGEESLVDLNSRLKEPVEMLRFRPNIVLSTELPYIEDSLERLVVNDVELIGVKNCARCIMITNDLNEPKLGKEPLKTLSMYRNSGTRVLFGRNFVIHKRGYIKVGDNVEKLT